MYNKRIRNAVSIVILLLLMVIIFSLTYISIGQNDVKKKTLTKTKK